MKVRVTHLCGRNSRASPVLSPAEAVTLNNRSSSYPDCKKNSNSGNGIYNDVSSPGNPLTNLVIDNNTIIGNNNAGILMDRPVGTTTSVTVSNNVMSGNGSAMVLFRISNATITGNTLANSAGSQLFLTGVTNSSITCNSIVNGLGNGVSVSTASGNTSSGITLNNNNIYNNAGVGLRVASGSYIGTLNAENNYWGDPSGPTIGTNPGGTGDDIFDPDVVVDYDPFLNEMLRQVVRRLSPAHP